MAYTHNMDVDVQFHPGVNIEQIREAFQPIMDYWGVKMRDTNNQWQFTGPNEALHYRVSLIETHGKFAYCVTLATGDEVGWDYGNLVKKCAKNLTGLCEPALFTLINFNYGNIDIANTTEYIWAGNPEEVHAAKREWAWRHAESILRENGFDETELEQLRGAKSVIEAQELEEGNMEEGDSILRRLTPAP